MLPEQALFNKVGVLALKWQLICKNLHELHLRINQPKDLWTKICWKHDLPFKMRRDYKFKMFQDFRFKCVKINQILTLPSARRDKLLNWISAKTECPKLNVSLSLYFQMFHSIIMCSCSCGICGFCISICKFRLTWFTDLQIYLLCLSIFDFDICHHTDKYKYKTLKIEQGNHTGRAW